MFKMEFKSAARLAATAGLGLSLAFAAAPVVAMANEPSFIKEASAVEVAIPESAVVALSDPAEPVDNADEASTDVATVDGVSYDSLAGAISNANGKTVELQKDIELSSVISIPSDSSVVLDLNGFNITGNAEQLISVPAGSTLTVQDDSPEPGEISGGTGRAVFVAGSFKLTGGKIASDGGQAVLVSNKQGGSNFEMTGGEIHGSVEALRGQWATINISGGRLITDEQSIKASPLALLASNATLSGDARLEGYCGVALFNITSAGAVDNDDTSVSSSFTMNGGSIDCYVYAISGNNMQSAKCSATINAGTVTAEDTCIYWPMEGTLTVNGGTVAGGNAIEAKMGAINIYGGTLRGTEEYGFAYTGNGSASDGAALKLVGQIYGGSEGQFISDPDLTVNVTGGRLESEHGNAVSVYVDDVASAYGDADLKASITVGQEAVLAPAENRDALRATSVGDFTISENGVSSNNTTITSPELAEAAVVANGKIQTSASTSQDGNTLYTTIGRALTSATATGVAADAGTTISLLRNVEEDVVIPENAKVKLDLGTHTLTGGVENKGALEIAGTGDLVGQVTGKEPTGSGEVTIVVATIGYNTYPSLEDAIEAVQSGQTIVLQADAKLSSRLAITKDDVTLDLGGHTISAASDFEKSSNNNDNQLVSIDGAENVTVKNGSIVAGGNNYHTLNVWNSEGVKLENLTLGHSEAYSGAPLIVGASSVTVSGDLNVVTGKNSWYGINVDSRMVGGTKTASSLTFAKDADVEFSGPSKTGVYIENSADMEKKDVVVSFEPGVTLSSDVDDFVPVSFAKKKDGAPVAGTVENPENAGLVAGPDGTFVPKPSTPAETGNAVKVEQAEGGKVSVTPARADEGDEVTITATPDKGQEVRSVTVTTKDGKKVKVTKGEKANTWTFEMPDAEVTVKVTFGCDGGELCPTRKFDDVDAGAWYHDAVDWAVEEGLLSGYEDGKLGPDGTLSRAQLATVLWRQAG
ncbi:MAG TPA: S-layer homology domain-containing protein, partial [Candidatus Limicola stercorigallinarum]|nr:S-layer homology domain-containing protein [Candidatus Limicola stercorigallinarum]